MKEHLLQSHSWEDYERLECKTTFRIEQEYFSALVVIKHTPLGNYLFCPYGPTITFNSITELKTNFQAALNSLNNLAKQHGAFFVRIEPCFSDIDYSTLKTTFCLKKSHDINPAHTWVLDLTQSESEIFAHMEKEKARLWRNHHKKGITIRQTKNLNEIDILISLLDKVGRQNHFIPQSKSHLINQLKTDFATLYIAEIHDTPLAASLIYDYNGTRYYAHAAANYECRKLSAGAILLVQMIIDAKHSGMQKFDFWGITTSRNQNHPWYGFTQFKKSFGGYQVNYAGTWDLPIDKTRYASYCLIRSINRFRRHLGLRRKRQNP